MSRHILASAPRVTRFKIDWEGVGATNEEMESSGAGPSNVETYSGLQQALCSDNDNSQSNQNAMEVMWTRTLPANNILVK